MKKIFLAGFLAAALTAAMGMTALAAEWKQDANGYWWQNDDGSYPVSTWEWLDGNGDGISECYYFDGNGYMASSTFVDGYQVNENGAWVQNGTVQVKKSWEAVKNSNDPMEILKAVSEQDATMDSLDAELAGIRAGRANPNVLNKIMVEYYGTPTPLQQVANVSVPEPRMIQIQPWEKSMIKEITKAIQTSDLGINPTNDGSSIRLIFPELTEERRKELAKDVKKKGEAAKVAIRNIRRDGNDTFKKLKGSDISEDEIKDLEDDLQKMTDKYIKKIDGAVEVKTKEVMTV